jgi:hypothetical protein
MRRRSEAKETPELEASYHTKGFLTKASKLADKKIGGSKKGKGTRFGKRRRAKRY